MYQAGTLSGNPLAVAAGLTALAALDEPGVYEGLEVRGQQLADGLLGLAEAAGVPMHIGRQGSMLCPYLSERPVHCFDDVMASDRERWTRFFHVMLEEGVHLPPSPFEAWFLSTAHNEAIIAQVLAAADKALRAIA